MHCIYAYKKIDENKIVYVGKTNNIKNRKRQHEKIDPYCITRCEYDYPLSRGIRKYGEDNYECIILEDNISDEDVSKREQYWINYYNTYLDETCYNQTGGGEGGIKYVDYSPETIARAKELIKSGKPFKEICEEIKMPMSTLSEINTGKRHFDSNEKYPLYELTRGRIYTKEEIEKLQTELILGVPILELMKKYDIPKSYLYRINNGTAHYNEKYSYPLYQYSNCKISQKTVLSVINELQNTNYSYKEIGKHYNISVPSVYRINKGTIHQQDEINYPIRK